MAYCLLGLFEINMSLLCGEGGNAAFQQLQLEIITRSDDESIFAWTDDEMSTTKGVLAYSPEAFNACKGYTPLVYTDTDYKALTRREPYQITNKGLRMEVHLLKLPELWHDRTDWIPEPFCSSLYCTVSLAATYN